MLCANCAKEIGPEEKECPNCGQPQGEVKVLTPEERENFQGITLGDAPEKEGSYQYESRGPGHRIYVRQVSFGAGKTSFWTKLIIAAVLGVLIFVFLPLALFFMLAVSLIWMIFRFLSR
jgi:hypothetical protein